MSENNRLYPFKLCRLEDNYSWGSESFLLADLGYRDSLVKEGWLASNSISEIMEAYMDRVVGDLIFSIYGCQFPVQVKLINCKGTMPLRVHPDDSIAESRFDALGKEKLWYIRKAAPGAKLYLGFNEDCDAASLLQMVQEGSLEKKLNCQPVKAGECYHIKPGTVHAASGDMEILEISQASALDFCVYPFGQELSPEEFDSALSLVEALDFINYRSLVPQVLKKEKVNGQIDKLLELPQFVVNKIALDTPLKISSENSDSFSLYHCLYGNAEVVVEKEGFALEEGQCLLVPAEIGEFTLSPLAPSTALLEVMGQCKISDEFGQISNITRLENEQALMDGVNEQE